LKWQELYLTEKPYQIFFPLDVPAAARSNLVFEEGPREVIHDARGLESQFEMDEHGFTYASLEVESDIFVDPSSIEANYLPRVESLIHEELKDVAKVYIFDWQVRLRDHCE
jgi:F420-dependent methylenetetrahydromethanopterin dehydrogenase